MKEKENNEKKTDKHGKERKANYNDRPSGSKSFDYEYSEGLSYESKHTHVKSLPNLKGSGKKKYKKEIRYSKGYDGLISNNENKKIEHLFCEKNYSVALDQSKNMKFSDTAYFSITSKPLEPQKPYQGDTSKVSFGLPSISRRTCPHKKHLLCRKFQSEGSEERESADFSSSSMSGYNWETTEKYIQKRMSQVLVTSYYSNKSETNSIVQRNDRISRILTKKSQRMNGRDNFKTTR